MIGAPMLVVVALLLPLGVSALVAALGRRPDVRDGAMVVVACALLPVVALLVPVVAAGGRPHLDVVTMLPGVPLAFEVEPLGLLFALVAATLWPITALYAVGYMRSHHEHHQTRFYVFFSAAISAALGVAFAGNLVTLFVFYELLTLSTFPLVTHHQDAEARAGGRVYLGILLGTSVAFLLLAIAITWGLTGTTDFRPGGILAGHVQGWPLYGLVGLFAFGVGKAALMPFHRWLPNAMVAPTPVSALLHAVAVVKAGVFTVLKVMVYTFGLDFLQQTGATVWLTWVAAFTILVASLVALTKDNFKERLAYSTVSQLGYIVLGAALATPEGVLGGGLHIAMHAAGKITLFFVAGAVMCATHKKNISEMHGLGWSMPWTFGAFAVGSLSVIGLPPAGGAWSKWYLGMGALEAGQPLLVAVLMISSLLNIAYLFDIAGRAFFLPAPAPAHDHAHDDDHAHHPVREGGSVAAWLTVIPPVITAGLTVALFVLGSPIVTFLRGILEGS